MSPAKRCEKTQQRGKRYQHVVVVPRPATRGAPSRWGNASSIEMDKQIACKQQS
jgi:hypothetical protein